MNKYAKIALFALGTIFAAFVSRELVVAGRLAMIDHSAWSDKQKLAYVRNCVASFPDDIKTTSGAKVNFCFCFMDEVRKAKVVKLYASRWLSTPAELEASNQKAEDDFIASDLGQAHLAACFTNALRR